MLLFLFIFISSIFSYLTGNFPFLPTIIISIVASLLVKDMIIDYMFYKIGLLKAFKIVEIKHQENNIRTRSEIYNYIQSNVDAVREAFLLRTLNDYFGISRAFHFRNAPSMKFTVSIGESSQSINILLSGKTKGKETIFDSLFIHGHNSDLSL